MKTVPAITSKHKTVDYADLEVGVAFMYSDNLYIKSSDPGHNQIGVCLHDGYYINGMCGEQVIPVNAEVKWSYKTQKKGK